MQTACGVVSGPVQEAYETVNVPIHLNILICSQHSLKVYHYISRVKTALTIGDGALPLLRKNSRETRIVDVARLVHMTSISKDDRADQSMFLLLRNSLFLHRSNIDFRKSCFLFGPRACVSWV